VAHVSHGLRAHSCRILWKPENWWFGSRFQLAHIDPASIIGVGIAIVDASPQWNQAVGLGSAANIGKSLDSLRSLASRRRTSPVGHEGDYQRQALYEAPVGNEPATMVDSWPSILTATGVSFFTAPKTHKKHGLDHAHPHRHRPHHPTL